MKRRKLKSNSSFKTVQDIVFKTPSPKFEVGKVKNMINFTKNKIDFSDVFIIMVVSPNSALKRNWVILTIFDRIETTYL